MKNLPGEAVRSIVEGSETGILWSTRTESLNLNLVAWEPEHVVEGHVNDAVDVVIIVLAGRGTVAIDEQRFDLADGAIVTIPRGAARSVTAETRLVYLTIHRVRPGLIPALPGER